MGHFITGKTRAGKRIRGRYSFADGRVTVTAIGVRGGRKVTHVTDEAAARALAPILLREIHEDAENAPSRP
jgi:hypothetical protein